MSASKSFNVLLLGESGNGKSTLINALANYGRYRTLSEAVEGELTCLSPTQITTIDDNFKITLINVGKHNSSEGTTAAGQVGTTACQSYLFNLNDDVQMRWIDTCGLGSKQGLQHDNDNVRDILYYCKQFQYLHAIAVVLNGKQTRLTPQFQYCLQTIMANLDKKSSKNLIFIFTHTSNFDLCAGLHITKVSLEQIKFLADIKLTKLNTFCFENDLILSLMSTKCGVNLEITNDSWLKTTSEFQRLINHVVILTAHDVRHAIYLNKVRKLGESVSKAFEDITKDIEECKLDLKKHQTEIETSDDAINKLLKEQLFTSVKDVVIEETPNARVVCASEKCCETYQLAEGRVKKHYPHICCEDCTVPYALTKFCAAMQINGHCRHCGCNFRVHQKLTYKTSVVETSVKSTDIQSEIASITSTKIKAQSNSKTIKDQIKTLKTERDIVKDSLVKLANFIKTHAILSDVREKDLCHVKRHQTSSDVNFFIGQLNDEKQLQRVTYADIESIKKQLLHMDIYGSKIKSQLANSHRKKGDRQDEVQANCSTFHVNTSLED